MVYTQNMPEATKEKCYSIGQLSSMAGVSVRTLHYYDQIGILNPSRRGHNNYRQYDHDNLLRLQQIMFFREMDLPLSKIRQILDDPHLDLIHLLEQHDQNLTRRIERLQKLRNTLRKTTQSIRKTEKMPLKDEELYQGFEKETIERYNREVRETYDPAIVKSVDQKVRAMSKTQWQTIQEEGKAIARELAKLTERAPEDPEVQALIARQHAWIENFYPATAEVFRGLGQLYAENEAFRSYYEAFAPDLADFMRKAMAHFADTQL
jgi:MerR family transcriptional regulator, thiopeptide resistance regulator